MDGILFAMETVGETIDHLSNQIHVYGSDAFAIFNDFRLSNAIEKQIPFNFWTMTIGIDAPKTKNKKPRRILKLFIETNQNDLKALQI